VNFVYPLGTNEAVSARQSPSVASGGRAVFGFLSAALILATPARGAIPTRAMQGGH